MKTYTEETARQIVATLDPEAQVRRWGFEIESPQVGEAKANSDWLEIRGLDFCSDGSLSGGDCDCECSDCYHSCDCDNCDRADYLDHCGDCGTNEVCSEEPVRTASLARWADFLARLARYWVPVERYGENWGGHIHIEARDLTKRQAVNVVAIATRLFELSPEWFVGEEDRYNSEPNRSDLENWARSERSAGSTQRGSWVNVSNLRAEPMPYQVGDEPDWIKSTIEFRRFRSTPDRTLIEFRALVCRKVVEYAKNTSSIYWATSAKTFDQLLSVLGV